MEYLLFLIATVLVNNVVLVYFLGLCPFMGVSSKLDPSLGMGAATTLVMTLGALFSWLLEHYVLQPLGIGFLRILAFILVIAGMVQFIEMAIRKISPPLYRSLGIYLHLPQLTHTRLGSFDIERETLGVDAKAVGSPSDVVLGQRCANGLSLLFQDCEEVDVVGEDDHLPDLGFLREALCYLPTASMVKGGDGVVKDNAPFALSQFDLCQEGCDGDGTLFTFAQDCGWRTTSGKL